MKTYTSDELAKIIESHRLWLRSEGGERANLRGADLSDADLSGANLRDADLSGANLRDADLSDAYLRGANLRGANLRDADLSGANLRDADLSGANLRDADLSGAALWNVTGNRSELKSIAVDTYSICYTDTHMQIGCEKHLIAEWKEFTDEEIESMDGSKALEFWHKFKDVIFTIIELSPAVPTNFVEKSE